MRIILKSDLIACDIYQFKKIMKKWIIIFLTLFLCCGLLIHVRTRNSTSVIDREVTFSVNKGDDIITIGQRLAQEQLIANRVYFYYYAWKNKLRGKFKEGEYVISPRSTIADIVYKLTTEGQALIEKEHDITVLFPEGWSLVKMQQRLNANGLPGNEFYSIALDPPPTYYQKYPFLTQGTSLEGYLFPDTYSFCRMLRQSRSFLTCWIISTKEWV